MTTQHMPLVVDLDGTLIKTDLLIESFLALIKQNPLYLFAVCWWLTEGKAALKCEIAERVDLDVTVLPYHNDLLAYLRQQHAQGRPLALATASHQKYAHQIAAHLGLFDQVLATDQQHNLAAHTKAARLCELFGQGRFVYAGNARPDLEVWRVSAAAIVVCASKALCQQAEKITTIERIFSPPKPSVKPYLKACRIHQWVKNTLIFVPVLAAHQLVDTALLLQSATAFLAFSLCASSVYLLNDLLDLDADRHHAKKCQRPFAAGDLPALHGIILMPLLLLASLLLCTTLPMAFGLVLSLYYLLTLAYSFALKQQVMLDVIVLAGLYTLRLLGGSAATGIVLSSWLLAFSMFIFLSLAMVKRYAELKSLKLADQHTIAKGRGYATDDLELLSALGGASGYISVLVMALYINSEDIQALYSQPQALWAVCPLLLYWVSRVWLIAHRGNMHDDPIVFALKDRVSRLSFLLIASILLFAAV